MKNKKDILLNINSEDSNINEFLYCYKEFGSTPNRYIIHSDISYDVFLSFLNKLENLNKITEVDNDFTNDTYEGNLIKIDFLINSVNIQPYYEKIFQWLSLYRNDTAICVSKSIDNAIRDVDVIPSNPKRRVIHTVFLKTASFNK
jgi:hypothetical protein